MYATAVPPPRPLQIGEKVHLYLVNPPPRSPLREAIIPLKIKGWIAEEHERTELEVEFVVRSDEEEAHVQRVFLRTSAEPRGQDAPTQRFERPPLRLSDVGGAPRRTKEARALGKWAGTGGPYRPRSAREAGNERRSARTSLLPEQSEPVGTETEEGRGPKQMGDRDDWEVWVPAREERRGGPGPQNEEAGAWLSYVAPGPTQRMPLPRYKPFERRRKGRGAECGRIGRTEPGGADAGAARPVSGRVGE